MANRTSRAGGFFVTSNVVSVTFFFCFVVTSPPLASTKASCWAASRSAVSCLGASGAVDLRTEGANFCCIHCKGLKLLALQWVSGHGRNCSVGDPTCAENSTQTAGSASGLQACTTSETSSVQLKSCHAVSKSRVSQVPVPRRCSP